MLPGHLAGHYGWADFHVDLEALARAAGAEFVLDRGAGLDLGAGRALLDGGKALPFDLLSLDIGSTSEPPALPGAEHLRPVKPMDAFLDAWNGFLADPDAASVAVLGGGVGGVELALAMAHRLRGRGEARVTLVEREAEIARELAPGARRRLEAALRRAAVVVRTGAAATAVTEAGVELAGECIAAGLVVAATGARAAPWLGESGLALSDAGFVRVGADLRALGAPRVFAVGDIAHLEHAPRPKAGVFAVRQGSVLHEALLAALDGRPLPTYHPQADYLRLVALGGRRALATKHGWTIGGDGPVGALLWRLKDRIDRDFMAKLKT